jgi:acyl-CoA reductase-like NAD-dependent aldehyde dehydrogenase
MDVKLIFVAFLFAGFFPVISPPFFPLLIAAWKLAAGNTCVLKSAETD